MTVLVLGLGVAAAGCSAEEAEPASLPPVPSASASALSAGRPSPERSGGSAAQVPVPAPSSASVATVDDASAFARHYLEVLTTSFQTADAKSLRALSDPGCGGCNNLIAAVEGAARAEEHTEGGVFAVVFAEAPPPAGGETTVELRYSRTAATIVDAAGHAVAQLPADPPLDAQMRIAKRGEEWVVLGFQATPK